MQNSRACYFRNWTEISREQRDFYNDGVWICLNNLLFNYITATPNQTLPIIVQTYKGESPEQAGFYNLVEVFLTPLRVWTSLHSTIYVWFLLHGNHTRIFFSYKICTRMFLRYKKPYTYSLFSHMGFKNPMPILELYWGICVEIYLFLDICI